MSSDTAVAVPKKHATERKVPTHPPASEMVTAALKALNDRKGSSLRAIKSYIAATYKVDIDRQAVFIRKFLKSAVERQELQQKSGNGAHGRFKLADKKKAQSELKKKKQVSKDKKEIKEKAEKKDKVVKKEKKEKKEKKVEKKVEKTEKKVKKDKSAKEKKTGKALATKTKPPKPKTAASSKSKKVAAKAK